MPESVLFLLPKSQEEALWAVPVLSQYILARLVTSKELPQADLKTRFRIIKKEPFGKIVVVCPSVGIHRVVHMAWKGMTVLEKITDEARNEAELIVEFNAKKAHECMKAIETHITDAYGHQIGCFMMSRLPAVAQTWGVSGDDGRLLVVERSDDDEERSWKWSAQNEFVELATQEGISVDTAGAAVPFAELVDRVSRASVVVGVRGTGTLVAASLGKIIMELSPEGFEHRQWMAKWEDPWYQMIYGNLDDMTAQFTLERTFALVERATKAGQRLWDIQYRQFPSPVAV